MTAYQHPTAGTCLATGKIKYINRKEAKRVVKARAYRGVNVYSCTDCGHIHIGGWHGIRDRVMHRELHDGDHIEPEPRITIDDAAAELGVSTDAIRLAIAAHAATARHTIQRCADREERLARIQALYGDNLDDALEALEHLGIAGIQPWQITVMAQLFVRDDYNQKGPTQ